MILLKKGLHTFKIKEVGVIVPVRLKDTAPDWHWITIYLL